MRIVKEAEERKNEILDVAGRLFGEQGYDATSTNDILKEIGIARGTLYYHFKSKEEILDAMIDRMTEQILEKAKSIVKQTEIPVLQRLICTPFTGHPVEGVLLCGTHMSIKGNV
ncbi:TetR/AcrR family transcriptional regulator [Agathobaculum desmolans]|uniref:TetR/AcrR family transcriptional regulator n=1 Tax=Agathobaculum desmolans TaxID=39484 RepID=UPI000B08AE34|nr:TetR/AcrR family transcriptional regulator [Agathobaculum desmolans]